MAGDLQALADSLGRRLERAVAIDDPHMRLLAYNSHYGHVDPVRTASILHRKAPAAAIAWVNKLGIREATAPLRIAANPSLAMDARICAPIRCQGHLLGYVWLVDTDSPLTDEDLEVADAAAQAAGEILHRERLLGELERGRERELLRDLLSGEPQVSQHAAYELVEAKLLVPVRSVAVIVVRPVNAGRTLDDAALVSIGLALDQVRRTVSPRHSLHLVRPDHSLFLVGADAPSLRPGGVAGLARQLADAVSAQLAEDGKWSTLVGVGETHPRLADAVVSYEQARQAARVAEIIASFRPVAMWSQLGIYRMLLRFPIEQLTSSALHPGLLQLFREADAETLVRTLERYFDLGCDARRTAADLCLHRASLYYRLHKIEQISGVSLRNGDDRLALHLGLKLARLAGILPGRADQQRAGLERGFDRAV
ncbi:MAG TPA: helix-turn-helix domain-containing protein [Candidatus Dormibacteraeota bacterium]|nr:helix-turn-helix domain-containing protein [Candidatus Dormibacteraeota bacterium]